MTHWRRPPRRPSVGQSTGKIHWYENVAPIGSSLSQPAVPNLGFVLIPIHNPAPIDVRAVTLISRMRTGATSARYATAIYKAVWPKTASKSTMATTPGQFSLQLVDRVGDTYTTSTSLTARHHISTTDIAIDLEPHFLAIQFDVANDVVLFAPVRGNTPHIAYEASVTGTAMGAFPREMSIDQESRQNLIYFVLRSAIGVRLYGDPNAG